MEDEFVERFEQVKGWILAVNAHNKVVSALAKTYTNFYSLWCFALLNENLPEPANFAPRYQGFMESVAAILKAEDPEQFLAGEDSLLYRHQFSYAQNARGANTELPQRVARHKALAAFITGVELPDEDQQ